MLSSILNNYSVSFTKRADHNDKIEGFFDPKTNYVKECERIANSIHYENKLSKRLKSTPNSDFTKKLSKIVTDPDKFNNSKVRVSNLSIYLKEQMVGFIVPKYTIKKEEKGGYEWFEKSLEFILKGCKKDCDKKDYKPLAKEFFGLLSLHDNYWKSQDFIDYLSTLKKSPAQEATIQAIKELCYGQQVSFGSFTSLKFLQQLLDGGCAYSGKKMVFCLPNDDLIIKDTSIIPSADHIMPKSWGGPGEDYNYILASRLANNTRGSISLLEYLKGNDG